MDVASFMTTVASSLRKCRDFLNVLFKETLRKSCGPQSRKVRVID